MTASPAPLRYFDNNATTACAPEVIEALFPYLGQVYGNPSSGHRAGSLAAQGIWTGRAQVASLLGCAPEELCFTSGGTESNTLAILGYLATCTNRTHLITTTVEHPAVRETLRNLREVGYELTELPVDAMGQLDPADLERALRPGQTALVSVMWANNETGVVQPIAECAALCAAAGVALHTDGVQAAGKIPVDLAAHPGITMLSLAGHKLHGPKGIGVLYVRQGTALDPCQRGGHQEMGLRAGTENVPGIVGLGAACKLAAKSLSEGSTTVRSIRDRLEATLLETIPDSFLNGHPTQRTPNTCNIGFRGISGSTALMLLDQEGIACSAGSACATGQSTASHVLKSMGRSDAEARASLRLSVSRYTTEEDVDVVIEALQRLVPTLRSMSGYTDPAAIAAYQAR